MVVSVIAIIVAVLVYFIGMIPLIAGFMFLEEAMRSFEPLFWVYL